MAGWKTRPPFALQLTTRYSRLTTSHSVLSVFSVDKNIRHSRLSLLRLLLSVDKNTLQVPREEVDPQITQINADAVTTRNSRLATRNFSFDIKTQLCI